MQNKKKPFTPFPHQFKKNTLYQGWVSKFSLRTLEKVNQWPDYWILDTFKTCLLIGLSKIKHLKSWHSWQLTMHWHCNGEHLPCRVNLQGGVAEITDLLNNVVVVHFPLSCISEGAPLLLHHDDNLSSWVIEQSETVKAKRTIWHHQWHHPMPLREVPFEMCWFYILGFFASRCFWVTYESTS